MEGSEKKKIPVTLKPSSEGDEGKISELLTEGNHQKNKKKCSLLRKGPNRPYRKKKEEEVRQDDSCGHRRNVRRAYCGGGGNHGRDHGKRR